ncbi:hypothetical protein C1886_24720 [Pseudomonas sp. FW300-N1A1]|nr:hypothetical protein C1886_24720 [Pseudomonas sp. FW300-N1A1]
MGESRAAFRLPAMVVNDDACSLTPRGVLGFIASTLAPTVDGCCSRYWCLEADSCGINARC